MTDAPQHSPGWYAARIGRVTGSSVGGILGTSPYSTREGVLRAMVREALGAPSEFPNPVPPPVAWGNAMEAQALADLEMDLQQDITPAPFVLYSDWLGASPDGFVGDKGVVEIKCPWSIRKDSPPVFKPLVDQEHYYGQVQVELFVTGRTHCHFFQWTPHGSKLETVHPDQDWLDANLPRLRQFWSEYADAVANPEDHLAPLRATIDTPAAHKMVAEYDQLVEAIANAEERKKELLAEMVTMAGDRNAMFAGRNLAKVERAGAVSYAKAIKALLPKADLEPYRGKPSSYWQVS